MPESLLPPNATKLERDLEQVMARATALPVAIRDLWDPATCPLPLLPWLAWAYAVDVWDSEWTEAQKRALGSLGYEIRVVEWFDDTPRAAPYTFRLDVLVANEGIDDRVYLNIERLVDSAKNVRSHLTALRAIVHSIGTVAVGSVVCTGETTRVAPLPDEPAPQVPVFITTATRTRIRATAG